MANPNDVFPRRNLPGEAEEWGRAVEERIRGVEYAAMGQKQGLSGQNRTSASSMQELARQIVQLRQFYNDLADLYEAIPKVGQVSGVATGFGLGPGWNTVLTSTLAIPNDSSTVTITANGSGQLVSTTTSSVVTSRSRLLIHTHVGPETPNAWFPGSGDFRSIMVPTGSATFTVDPGSVIGISFQINPDDPGAYGYNPASYAVVSALATFTG